MHQQDLNQLTKLIIDETEQLYVTSISLTVIIQKLDIGIAYPTRRTI